MFYRSSITELQNRRRGCDWMKRPTILSVQLYSINARKFELAIHCRYALTIVTILNAFALMVLAL